MVIAHLLAAASAVASPAPPVTNADLVEVTDISSVAVSPDGRYVAFRTARPSIGDNHIHLQWYVAPANGKAPARPMGDGGDPDIDSGTIVSQPPVWAPSSNAFYFRAAFNGQVQVWRAPVVRGSPRQLTENPADVRAIKLSADGRSIELSVGVSRDVLAHEVDKERDRGVLIDGTVDTTAAILDNGIVNGVPGTLRFKGDWFDRRPLLWDRDVHTELMPLSGDDLSVGQPAPNPAPVSVRVEVKGDVQMLSWTDVRHVDHVIDPKARPAGFITSAKPRPGTADVVVTFRDDERAQALWIWTPASDHWRRLAGAGRLNSGTIDLTDGCAVAQTVIACVSADADGPPRVVAIDPATGDSRTLFNPNPSLRSRAWPAQAIRWKTSQGIPVAGQLVLPRGPRPSAGYPLVIDYYECDGFLKGGMGDELPLVPLAESGIASLCINKALSLGKTDPWMQTTGVDAVSTIIGQLTRDGIVDRSRIGMAGLSFGSGVTISMLERTSLLRAAAIATTQIDHNYFWAASVPGRAVPGFASMPDYVHEFFGIGNPDTDPQSWTDHAAVGGAGKIRAPLLMQLPESEMRLSVELYARIANSTTPVEMFAFANETHMKWEPRHKLAVYDRNLDWFRFWLLGEEDADPEKADQYRRWRAFSARPGFALPVEDHPAPKLGVH
jgi:dipeptidyl aminopeptidase/acylaminoacyl peptidase